MQIGPQPFRMELIACLRRLAAAAEAQTEYLRKLGVDPSADELGLELHELALRSREKVRAGELSIAEKAAVDRLDRKLESFSGQGNESLWTIEALASADEWRTVRAMATECLTVLGETQ